MLAVPVLVIVVLFLAWALVRLSENALALFIGLFAAIAGHDAGAGWPLAITLSAFCGICVMAFGRNASNYVRTPFGRLVIGSAFAGPAAAWSAAHRISSLFGAGVVLQMAGSIIAAVVIGSMARSKVLPAQNRPAA